MYYQPISIIKSFVLLVLISVLNQVYAFEPAVFKKEIESAGKAYTDFQSKEGKLLFQTGQISIATSKLTSLVKNKGFYDYFILGNMLFDTDPELSYGYMKKAENLNPDNPFVLYERGIHEHRLNHYQEARQYYKRFLDTKMGQGHINASAYITHTNLMTGHIKEAYSSWKDADFSNNHTAIEQAMYPIFSNINQNKQREYFISDIKNGQPHKVCDLIYLDTNWETDWWNYGPNKFYLEFDKELAKDIMKESPNDKGIIDFCMVEENFSPESIMHKLDELKISNGKHLPQSSALIYKILSAVINNKLMSETEFLGIFEKHLQEMLKKHPKDNRVLEILAYLYSATNNKPKLMEIDLKGWQNNHLENFAASYISALEKEKIKSPLNKALQEFPNNHVLNNIYLTLYGQKDKQALARFVASQFANVKNNWYGEYRLSDYMASLEHEIDKLENKTNQSSN